MSDNTVIFSYTIDQAIADGTHVDAKGILPDIVQKPKFNLGRIVMTTGVFDLIEEQNLAGQVKENKPGCVVTFQSYQLYLTTRLEEHSQGIWGNVCAHDAKINCDALDNGGRLLSSYSIDPRLPQRGNIWIITEASRSLTTLLLPEEY
jgi:hypothetical protein